jgi:hypothetical protein
MTGSELPIAAGGGRQKSANSIEKNGFSVRLNSGTVTTEDPALLPLLVPVKLNLRFFSSATAVGLHRLCPESVRSARLHVAKQDWVDCFLCYGRI